MLVNNISIYEKINVSIQLIHLLRIVVFACFCMFNKGLIYLQIKIISKKIFRRTIIQHM